MTPRCEHRPGAASGCLRDLVSATGERDCAAVAPLVLAVHERWDGSGYPDRLAGEAIPIESRIVAVCDAWDAMTSDRPYRQALGEADTRAELARGAGSQFDPTVVTAFLGM